MARGIDDVDTVVAPANRRVLGQDRYAALAFEVIGIHDPFGHNGALVQCPGLLQQAINQGRLAMVNMRNDRDIAYSIGGEHCLGRNGRSRIISTLQPLWVVKLPLSGNQSALHLPPACQCMEKRG